MGMALELEAQAQSMIRQSPYHRESVERFRAKQPLQFRTGNGPAHAR